MEKTIVLSQTQKNTLLDHAKKNPHIESCALLLGNIEFNTYKVKDIYLTENIENSAVNFTISNEQLLAAYQEAERRELDIVGIFHSHPHWEAIPSQTDKKFMIANPVVWIIYSNEKDQMGGFILESDIEHVLIKINGN